MQRKPGNPYRNMEINMSLPLPVDKSPKHNRTDRKEYINQSIELSGIAAIISPTNKGAYTISSKKERIAKVKG